MQSKAELIAEIDKLIYLLRMRSTSLFALTLLPKSLADKVADFSGKCIDLQKRVIATEDGTPEILELEKVFLGLEIWVKRRVAKNNL